MMLKVSLLVVGIFAGAAWSGELLSVHLLPQVFSD